MAINFLTRQFTRSETLQQGLVSMVVLLLVNTLLCLVIRELIHRFKLDDITRKWVWLKLSIIIVVMGFISSLMMTLAIGYYFMLAGYSSQLVFFILTVYQNWLIMILMLGIWSVVYVIIMHIQAISQLQSEQQQVKLQLKEAELNHLIGQLNPHFLFNGLNNIRALIMEDGQKARHMLTELADLLRYSLNSSKQNLTALSQELAMVRAYVQLAQIQYEERLQYHEDIDPDLLDHLMPPLLIQLLVENAIRHGIDHHVGAGQLQLHIHKDQTQLHIQLTNPGTLNPQRNEQSSSGLGLPNIRKRLQLLFPERHQFAIEEHHGLVTATVAIPLITDVNEVLA